MAGTDDPRAMRSKFKMDLPSGSLHFLLFLLNALSLSCHL